MKNLVIVLIVIFSGCQLVSKDKHQKEGNGGTSTVVNHSGELSFFEYVKTIPEVQLPVIYNDYEKLFIPCKEQSCNMLCIDKKQLQDLQFYYIKRFDFDEIKRCYGLKQIPNSEEFKYGPWGGKFEAELGITCPIFHCKNENLILIGYLSEWWIRSEGGDFYEPRAQIDLIIYDKGGKLIQENISDDGSGFPTNQLVVNLPDFNGCREIRGEIKSWHSILVHEKLIQEYEIKLSENGLDEEYIEYEKPKVITKEIVYTISGNGIIGNR